MSINIKVEIGDTTFDVEAPTFEIAQEKLKDIENYLNKKEAEQEARIDEN